jgi:aminoglycoside phosphotransferase (APT) family kinase protein
MLTGESGRSYYARPVRRYERALAEAAGRLAELRRASQDPVTIDEPEFERLCGAWLGELRVHLADDHRRTLDRLAAELRETLLGATLPLGWYHGDYDFANLLYDRGDRLAGIIDFELFDARGLPLVDLMVLLARRAVRRRKVDFGTLFLNVILPRALPRFEASLLGQELEAARADGRLYRALALCCWLEHVRLRRDSWLVRSRAWRRTNVEHVLGCLATAR